MAQYRFNRKIRVAVMTETGTTQVYVAPDKADMVEKKLLAEIGRRGARRPVMRRSHRGDGTELASTAALLRRDGTPVGITIANRADRDSTLIVVSTNQGTALAQRWIRNIENFKTPQQAYHAAVRVLAGRWQLNGKQVTTLRKAWPTFARRYGL